MFVTAFTNKYILIYVSGFGDRLLSEVKKLAPKDIKIRVGKNHL